MTRTAYSQRRGATDGTLEHELQGLPRQGREADERGAIDGPGSVIGRRPQDVGRCGCRGGGWGLGRRGVGVGRVVRGRLIVGVGMGGRGQEGGAGAVC